MGNLPEGKLIGKFVSPEAKYEIRMYICDGGTTSADSIRGEVVYVDRLFKKTKNIYWANRESMAVVVWIDDNTVKINGRELDVRYDTYDFRKDKSYTESLY